LQTNYFHTVLNQNLDVNSYFLFCLFKSTDILNYLQQDILDAG